jgi:hypothetical protein
LAQVGRGWAALCGHADLGGEEYTLIIRAALDSIPPERKRVLLALAEGKSAYSLGSPEVSVNRAVEDLRVIGLTTKDGENWKLSEIAMTLVSSAFPQCVQTEQAG